MKKKANKTCGFALVVTLSLMALLAIISLGILGLSTITLRVIAEEENQAKARANAHMALMVAIGELQKHTGPDTRITAPSGIVDEDAPPLTGAWRSWEGSDHDSSGRPVAPDYDSKTRPETETDGRFLTWLVSGAAYGASPTDPSALAFSAPTETSIPLLSTGTLAANDTRQVHVIPQPVNDTGTMAWWVSGENQKARLSRPYKPTPANAASWSDIAKSHSEADPKPLGLDVLLDENSEAAQANNRGTVISRATADFLADANADPMPREFFHDLSVSSTGLLTNTATGGWRKDLSFATENWDQLPASGLPLFRFSPEAGHTSHSERPTPTNPRSYESIFYPWSDYSRVISDAPLHQHGAVTSWQNLVEYATAYKRIEPSTDGKGSIPFSRTQFSPSGPPEIVYNYLHTIRTSPVIARIQWVFSHWTQEITPPTVPKTYRLHLLITPVVTLWNPHNVSVTTTSDGIMPFLAKSPPCVLLYYNREGTETVAGRKLIRGTRHPAGNYDQDVENYPDRLFNHDRLGWRIPGDFTLLPGETRVFSPASAVVNAQDLNMVPGYNPTGGHIRTINFIGPPHREGDQVKLDIKFDNLINMGRAGNPLPGSGIWLEVYDNPVINIYERHMLTVPLETARTYWPEMQAEELPNPEAQELTGGWRPFFSTVYGFRMSSDTNLPGRGLVQTNPLVRYSLMTATDPHPGADHPANATMDFSFFAHSLGGDDKLPNADNTNHRGYIISGFQASRGLSRVILSEFPLRPLASLAELQNWDLRTENPIPPFQLNLIGNSDATPLLPSDQVFNPVGGTENMQHDDAYCANHLLFDDWFFSSIAPEPANFGNLISADIMTRYRQFLDGNQPLTNRSYVRIREDQSLDPDAREALVDDMLGSGIHDSWQRIASRLEVEGMFNVNSTSVTAWRALLGHARNREIPYYTEDGISLSGETDHAFTRSVVAADVEAGRPGSMSGGFPGSSELTGYRVFDDELLDSLAEKIVEQVQLRGPFLSLSEFVNRQLAPVDAGKKLDSLTAQEKLALAGAIQTALNEMAKDAGNDDPHKTLKENFSEVTTDPGDEKVQDAGYRFAAAAMGHSTFGLPGWIRQADVLRPLAPILSARDDTFTIRAYGDVRDQNGKVLSRAWCEATVRRTRNFIDPADPADSIDAPGSQTNVAFGRRYEISSFRWLSPDEL